MNKPNNRNPWAWVPSLYFAEGIPYVMVMTVSVIMYKKFGISNTDIALYTSWLYLPWVIKPLWSPFVDMFKTKRFWIVTMQLCIGAALAGIALTIPVPNYFQYTIAVFWLMAFSSATHDIAADGFYLLGLDESNQAAFIGIRNTFYRIAMLTGQGALVVVAGTLESKLGIQQAWSITFYVIAAFFFILFLFHRFMLPYPASDKSTLQISKSSAIDTRINKEKNIATTTYPLLSKEERKGRSYFGFKMQSYVIFDEFIRTFVLFFKRKDIWLIFLFLFFYRFAEAQLVKLVSPFLLDVREKGGLGLSTSEVGIVYGTVGIIALTAGGLLGGYVISKKGLRTWLWPMVIIMHTPDLMFVYLSHFQPSNFLLINCAVALEQFGYGFGFAAYTMYMIYVSQGEHKTAHYAICTGIMALGMMLPGMISGKIQELIGYQHFFLWVMISTIPGFIVAALVKIDPEFGKKRTKV
jgi:MFS transporter, PAT family, beta-lactamase induction signal transducer AmpG